MIIDKIVLWCFVALLIGYLLGVRSKKKDNRVYAGVLVGLMIFLVLEYVKPKSISKSECNEVLASMGEGVTVVDNGCLYLSDKKVFRVELDPLYRVIILNEIGDK